MWYAERGLFTLLLGFENQDSYILPIQQQTSKSRKSDRADASLSAVIS